MPYYMKLASADTGQKAGERRELIGCLKSIRFDILYNQLNFSNKEVVTAAKVVQRVSALQGSEDLKSCDAKFE